MLEARVRTATGFYFQADTACPIFEALAQILAKTVGITDVLQATLEPAPAREYS